MKVYNTLTRQKEEFIPREEGKVKMYVCGPTVYDYIHIGNARPYVVFDTVRRYLEYKGYDVTYVQNFTDVDDKIINRANKEGSTMEAISNRYIEEAFHDADGLNVKRATVHPRVTQEMDGIIAMVQTLIDKGFAYEDNGTVYYDTKKFPEYGKLSKKNLDELIAGASERVAIEDLIFPHHENEIAQSEAANGCQFAKYWLHNGFITVDNEKMSKSLGNFFTVRDIAAQFPYEVIRFFILNGHYRSPINFSRDLMQACQNGLERIKNARKELDFYIKNSADTKMTAEETAQAAELEKYKEQFEAAMDDDFNTADAISVIYELVRFSNIAVKAGVSKEYAEKIQDMLDHLCGVLGVAELKEDAVSDEETAKIEELIAKRAEAKKAKDFATADAIRDELAAMGITIKDTRQGVQWFRG